MICFLFMSHRIRQKNPRGPVIVAQHSDGRTEEGNMVVINGPSVVRFDPRGLPLCDTHTVTAWIEADSNDVVVR